MKDVCVQVGNVSIRYKKQVVGTGCSKSPGTFLVCLHAVIGGQSADELEPVAYFISVHEVNDASNKFAKILQNPYIF